MAELPKYPRQSLKFEELDLWVFYNCEWVFASRHAEPLCYAKELWGQPTYGLLFNEHDFSPKKSIGQCER
jgi:hypothetical protein